MVPPGVLCTTSVTFASCRMSFFMCNTPTAASSLFLVLDVYLCKRVDFVEIM